MLRLKACYMDVGWNETWSVVVNVLRLKACYMDVGWNETWSVVVNYN